jgi:uncharacterized membrane protein YccF (DUF307 family)
MVTRTVHAAATLLNVLWGIVAGLAFCLWTLAMGLAVVPMILVVAVRGTGAMIVAALRGLAPEAGLPAPDLRERNARGPAAVTL